MRFPAIVLKLKVPECGQPIRQTYDPGIGECRCWRCEFGDALHARPRRVRLARSMEHQNGHLGKHNLTHNRAFTIGREVTPKAVEQMEGSKRHGNNYSRP